MVQASDRGKSIVRAIKPLLEYLPAEVKLLVLSNEFSAFSIKLSVFTESYTWVINLMFISCTCKRAAFVRE